MSKKKRNMQRPSQQKAMTLGQAQQVLQEHDAAVHLNAVRSALDNYNDYHETFVIPVYEAIGEIYILLSRIDAILSFPSLNWIQQALVGVSENLSSCNQAYLNQLNAMAEFNKANTDNEDYRKSIKLSNQIAILANNVGRIVMAEPSRLTQLIKEAQEDITPILSNRLNVMSSIKYGKRKSSDVDRICARVHEWRQTDKLSSWDKELDRLQDYYRNRHRTEEEEIEYKRVSEYVNGNSLRMNYGKRYPND